MLTDPLVYQSSRCTPNTDVLAALGELALRHADLDYVLRLTVKTITELPLREGLMLTQRSRGSKRYRELVLKHARRKLGDDHEAVKELQAFMERARAVSETRNRYLHGIWVFLHGIDGPRIVDRDDNGNRVVSAIPSVEALRDLTASIVNIIEELNHSRLGGFLYEALQMETQG